MVRIRLRRVGAKKQPHYRVVVADHRSPRDGRHVEIIGYYDPRTQPETVVIKEDRALYWLGEGAQPSDMVRRMLEKQGTLARLARLKAGAALETLVAEFEAGGAVAEAVVPTEPPAEAASEAPEAPAPAEEETEPATEP
jgi:small subunit ribosomal protein S16